MNKELEEAKEYYKEIKRNKDIIGSIEKDFFFNFGDLVIRELEELQEENKILRIQLNSAFDNGFIHRDKIREILKTSKEKEESGAYRYDELYSYLYHETKNCWRKNK